MDERGYCAEMRSFCSLCVLFSCLCRHFVVFSRIAVDFRLDQTIFLACIKKTFCIKKRFFVQKDGALNPNCVGMDCPTGMKGNRVYSYLHVFVPLYQEKELLHWQRLTR